MSQNFKIGIWNFLTSQTRLQIVELRTLNAKTYCHMLFSMSSASGYYQLLNFESIEPNGSQNDSLLRSTRNTACWWHLLFERQMYACSTFRTYPLHFPPAFCILIVKWLEKIHTNLHSIPLMTKQKTCDNYSDSQRSTYLRLLWCRLQTFWL